MQSGKNVTRSLVQGMPSHETATDGEKWPVRKPRLFIAGPMPMHKTLSTYPKGGTCNENRFVGVLHVNGGPVV